jgi:2-dehydro-3-deoxyphosphooctonate aldolase (KDO 8-P synthase)
MNAFSLGKMVLGEPGQLFFIAGPCVIENETHAMGIAGELAAMFSRLGQPLIFKASYDKANRSSVKSFRGPGLTAGLAILKRIKEHFQLPILTDVHDVSQVGPAAEVADILQVPAFLSRQTDLLLAAGRSGRIVNVKKGQFLAPWDMANIVEKIRSTGNDRIILTERGFSFGYNNLVVDFRSFPIMRRLGCPVVFDATHSVQLPGGAGNASSGDAAHIQPLARAAVACGVDGLFFEVHDCPAEALCDGPNAINLRDFEQFIRRLLRIQVAAQGEDAHEP